MQANARGNGPMAGNWAPSVLPNLITRAGRRRCVTRPMGWVIPGARGFYRSSVGAGCVSGYLSVVMTFPKMHLPKHRTCYTERGLMMNWNSNATTRRKYRLLFLLWPYWVFVVACIIPPIRLLKP